MIQESLNAPLCLADAVTEPADLVTLAAAAATAAASATSLDAAGSTGPATVLLLAHLLVRGRTALPARLALAEAVLHGPRELKPLAARSVVRPSLARRPQG